MPNDPERPIENLLRACAQKRRQEAGQVLELHPADRRRLQAEVVKMFGSPAPQRGGWLAWLSKLGPRLALGFGLVVAVGLVIRLALPSSPQPKAPDLLAKNEGTKALQAQSSAELSPPAMSTAANAPASQSLALPEKAKVTLAESRVDGQRDLANEPSPVEAAAAKDASLPSVESSLVKEAVQAAAPSPAKTAFLDQLSTAAPQPSQNQLIARYVQTPGQHGVAGTSFNRATAGAPILTSFQVEQNGQQVRVIDQDGSVYTGMLQQTQTMASVDNLMRLERINASDAEPARKSRQANVALARRFQAQAPGVFSFQVAGTNVSLKQQVVFTGQLWPLAYSAAGVGPSSNAFGAAAGRLGAAGKPELVASPEYRISGKAVLGDGQEIQINAAPAK